MFDKRIYYLIKFALSLSISWTIFNLLNSGDILLVRNLEYQWPIFYYLSILSLSVIIFCLINNNNRFLKKEEDLSTDEQNDKISNYLKISFLAIPCAIIMFSIYSIYDHVCSKSTNACKGIDSTIYLISGSFTYFLLVILLIGAYFGFLVVKKSNSNLKRMLGILIFISSLVFISWYLYLGVFWILCSLPDSNCIQIL